MRKNVSIMSNKTMKNERYIKTLLLIALTSIIISVTGCSTRHYNYNLHTPTASDSENLYSIANKNADEIIELINNLAVIDHGTTVEQYKNRFLVNPAKSNEDENVFLFIDPLSDADLPYVSNCITRIEIGAEINMDGTVCSRGNDDFLCLELEFLEYDLASEVYEKYYSSLCQNYNEHESTLDDRSGTSWYSLAGEYSISMDRLHLHDGYPVYRMSIKCPLAIDG